MPVHSVECGINQLNTSLADAKRNDSLLTENQWELLGAIVTAAVSIALLPEVGAALATYSALSAVLALSSGFGLATSAVLIPTLAMNELVGGANLGDEQRKQLRTLARLTGNPFSLLGGVAGGAIDGEYGLEVGTTAGQFLNFFSDFGEGIDSLLENKDISLHLASILNAFRELPSGVESEHIKPGQGLWASNLSADSMTDDMVQTFPWPGSPAVASITQLERPRSGQIQATMQKNLDTQLFGSEPDPLSNRISNLPPPQATPSPQPNPTPRQPLSPPPPRIPALPLPPNSSPPQATPSPLPQNILPPNEQPLGLDFPDDSDLRGPEPDNGAEGDLGETSGLMLP